MGSKSIVLQVLLDDVDIKDLNLHWLRDRLALVNQEPVLFNMTVAGEKPSSCE